ncbi:MAG TPA: integrase core domain-containing protein, partial [Chloroflexota bacterium]|nr:integrase core domain-containing protein [Chloroflexota bacterium]
RRHLEVVLAEYIEHYNSHRPHRYLNQLPPCHGAAAQFPIADLTPTQVRRIDILDGLIHEYSRAA